MRDAAAVLFDLDGTLTRPVLDFGAIREELGVPAGISILAAIEAAERDTPARGRQMRAILDRHELAGAEATQPNEGALEVLEHLEGRGVAWAVVTRNARLPAQVTLRHLGIPDAVLVSREDATPKPHPAPVHLACRHLGLDAPSTWFVGDYVDDIASGRAAGCAGTVLVTNGSPAPAPCEPTLTVARLSELLLHL